MASSTRKFTFTALFSMLVAILVLPSPSYSEPPNFDTKKINNSWQELSERAEIRGRLDFENRDIFPDDFRSEFENHSQNILQQAASIESSIREVLLGRTSANFVHVLLDLSSGATTTALEPTNIVRAFSTFFQQWPDAGSVIQSLSKQRQHYDREALEAIAYDLLDAFEAYEQQARDSLRKSVKHSTR